MMINEQFRRILIADCGLVTTKVVLIDQVDDQSFALLALAETISTHGPPWQDVTLGVVEAIEQIEAQTGRRLLNRSGAPLVAPAAEAEGVDAFIAVTDAAQPVRVLLAGLTDQLSLESARHALQTTYTTIERQLTLADPVPARRTSRRLAVLQETPVDLILLVGGTDQGSTDPVLDLAYTIAMALQVMPPLSRPEVIFAGNISLRPRLAEILGRFGQFKPVDNVRPGQDTENLFSLGAEVNRLYVERKIAQLPGAERLSRWVSASITPKARAYAQTIHYLSRQYRIAVLGAYLDRADTTVTVQREGVNHTTILADAGVAGDVASLLTQQEIADFLRWLPFEMPADLFRSTALNRALYPQTVPQTPRDLLLELAVARQCLRSTARQARPAWLLQEDERQIEPGWNLVLGSGYSLTRIAPPALAALTLLDGLEPVGIFNLALDRQDLLAMFGTLAATQPVAAAQLLETALHFTEDGLLVNLGTVVAPDGLENPGARALRLELVPAEGEKIEAEIAFGEIALFPLAINQEATLKIRPSRYLTIDPQQGEPGQIVEAVVTGGLLGVIIDARGRPLQFDRSAVGRRRQMIRWLIALGVPWAAQFADDATPQADTPASASGAAEDEALATMDVESNVG